MDTCENTCDTATDFLCLIYNLYS